MRAVFLFLLLLGVCGRGKAYDVSITSENAETIIGQDSHVLVKYYAPNCEQCTEFEPVWEEVKDHFTELKTEMVFAKVDCAAEVELCKIQGFRSLPALTFFSIESTVSEMYIGKMDKVNVTEFITKSVAQECTFLNLDRCTEKQHKWMDEHVSIKQPAVEKLINDCTSDLEKVNGAYEKHTEDMKKQLNKAREKYDEYVRLKNLELKWYRAIRREIELQKSPEIEL